MAFNEKDGGVRGLWEHTAAIAILSHEQCTSSSGRLAVLLVAVDTFTGEVGRIDIVSAIVVRVPGGKNQSFAFK